MRKPRISLQQLAIFVSSISLLIAWNQPVFAQENYRQPTVPTGEVGQTSPVLEYSPAPRYSISTDGQNLVNTPSKSIQQSPALYTGLAIGTASLKFDSGYVAGIVGAKYGNLAISLDVINITFTELKGGGYYRDTFKNGQSRCRSSSTGRFATNASCSGSTKTEFSYLSQVDLTYALPISNNESSILLGAGLNFSESNQVYGVIGYAQKNAYLKALIGNDSINLRLGAFLN